MNINAQSVLRSAEWNLFGAINAKVYLTMLMLADKNGVVNASIPYITNVCGVLEQSTGESFFVESAIERFLEDGIMEESADGWRFLNADRLNSDYRRLKQGREAVARYRQRASAEQ